jgi:hypothetical protein
MSRLERRVSKIATPDLLSWAEQSMNSLGRELGQYRRTGDATRLEEAESSAEAVLALLREMRSRASGV